MFLLYISSTSANLGVPPILDRLRLAPLDKGNSDQPKDNRITSNTAGIPPTPPIADIKARMAQVEKYTPLLEHFYIGDVFHTGGYNEEYIRMHGEDLLHALSVIFREENQDGIRRIIDKNLELGMPRWHMGIPQDAIIERHSATSEVFGLCSTEERIELPKRLELLNELITNTRANKIDDISYYFFTNPLYIPSEGNIEWALQNSEGNIEWALQNHGTLTASAIAQNENYTPSQQNIKWAMQDENKNTGVSQGMLHNKNYTPSQEDIEWAFQEENYCSAAATGILSNENYIPSQEHIEWALQDENRYLAASVGIRMNNNYAPLTNKPEVENISDDLLESALHSYKFAYILANKNIFHPCLTA